MHLTERAKALVLNSRTGVLSTHSVRYPGYPFGSAMPYAAGAEGSPIFFMSGLALHTQNIQNDARATLFIQEENDSARITLLGRVEPAIRDEVSELYLSRIQEARQWQHFEDFAFYRLTPSHVYVIEGFGMMGWISGEQHRNACLTI